MQGLQHHRIALKVRNMENTLITHAFPHQFCSFMRWPKGRLHRLIAFRSRLCANNLSSSTDTQILMFLTNILPKITLPITNIDQVRQPTSHPVATKIYSFMRIYLICMLLWILSQGIYLYTCAHILKTNQQPKQHLAVLSSMLLEFYTSIGTYEM